MGNGSNGTEKPVASAQELYMLCNVTVSYINNGNLRDRLVMEQNDRTMRTVSLVEHVDVQ